MSFGGSNGLVFFFLEDAGSTATTGALPPPYHSALLDAHDPPRLPEFMITIVALQEK